MAMKMTKVELVKMVEELQTEIADLKGEVADMKAKSESLEDSDTTGESTSNLGTSSDSEEPTTSDEEFINDSSESEDSIEEINTLCPICGNDCCANDDTLKHCGECIQDFPLKQTAKEYIEELEHASKDDEAE
jgi:hypothetical protein